MLKEAQRLHSLGFGLHWLKPRSKVPVKAGWSGPRRDPWDQLQREYQEGYGLGVRMGEASKVGDYFLANIDVDIKSTEARHRAQAFALVREKFPGLLKKAPVVATAYGFRLFVVTKTPVLSGKLGSSPDEVRVFLPSSEINKRQQRAVESRLLTAADLKAGWRVRQAWEVEFMSTGKQVVLPPSVHPDTGELYTWRRPIHLASDLPLAEPPSEVKRGLGRPVGSGVVQNFKPVPVDLNRLSGRTKALIDGDGVEDRSAACFSVALTMSRAGYSDLEIMTVLTDRKTFLGETAYDHRSTDRRSVAAAWIRDYCIRKARETTDAARAFKDEVVISTSGKPADVASVDTGNDWRQKLTRGGQDGNGAPRPTLENTVLILRNAGHPKIFKRDSFANRDTYGVNAPWGGVKDRLLTDEDAAKIKLWLGEKFRVEPPTGTIFDAMSIIAGGNAHHPIIKELEALPAWDGKERLNTWLKDHFNARGPDEYLAQVFRKWLVASVARIYRPGFKFDWLPIFEGRQGTGKSSFGTILFGEPYFTDWLPDLADKDAALNLQGKRCAEFAELDQMRRNQIETIKAFVTRQVDNVRPPYGRKTIEIYRQTVFFGTTNKDEYLKDETGNRRFNPVKVGRLNFKRLEKDREQLWAEAYFLHHNYLEPWLWLDNGAEKFAKEIQADKMVTTESSFMVDSLRDYFGGPGKDLKKVKLVTLFEGLGPLREWQKNGKNIQFATISLKIMGFTKHKIMGQRYWKRN